MNNLTDYDMRHYRFARSSGLPGGYFKRRISVDAIVLWAILACGAVTVALFAVGVIA